MLFGVLSNSVALATSSIQTLCQGAATASAHEAHATHTMDAHCHEDGDEGDATQRPDMPEKCCAICYAGLTTHPISMAPPHVEQALPVFLAAPHYSLAAAGIYHPPRLNG